MRCVVVIPVFREHPDKYEEISLKQCAGILGKYPVRILAPNGLNLESFYKLFTACKDFGHIYFHKKYFRSPQTYNRFMKSPKLYKALEQYAYFLMHHMDAFVFRDELEYWCDKGYDMIGAPIYKFDGTIEPKKYLGVGNSGFSLHKISSALKVLRSFKRVYSFKEFLGWYRKYNWKGRIYHFPYFVRMLAGLGGWSHHLFNYSKLNEDIFWGIQVPAAFPEFKVAPFEEAYKFSMEYNCEKLIELNNGNLPFGCHQWYKGEFLGFWKKSILEEGYEIQESNSL